MSGFLRFGFLIILCFTICYAQNNTDGEATVITSPIFKFNVEIASKTPSHPLFGEGSSLGFLVDGIPGPTLIMKRRTIYEFVVQGSCDNPFYFTTSTKGGPNGEGVAEEATITAVRKCALSGSPGESVPCACEGETIGFYQKDETPGDAPRYYMSTNEDSVGGSYRVVKNPDKEIDNSVGRLTSFITDLW